MYNNIVGLPLKNGIIKLLIIFFCGLYYLISGFIWKRGILLTGSFICLLFLYYLATRYNLKQFLTYFGIFISLSLFIQNVIKNEKLSFLLDSFSKIVTVIAGISIFFWLFGSILHFLPCRIVSYYWGRDYPYTSYNYFWLYFENPVQAMGSIIRNTGIYTEAPGYVCRLAPAIGIELFYFSKKPNIKRLLVLFLTMLTTLSSKAFIILVYLIRKLLVVVHG